jgi:hypothetical protein
MAVSVGTERRSKKKEEVRRNVSRCPSRQHPPSNPPTVINYKLTLINANISSFET